MAYNALGISAGFDFYRGKPTALRAAAAVAGMIFLSLRDVAPTFLVISPMRRLSENGYASQLNGANRWRAMMRLLNSAALGIALVVGTALPSAAQNTGAEPSAPTSSTMPQWAQPDPIANEGVIEDEAISALKEMSAFLAGARTLQIVSNGSLDVVTNNGQRIQLDGSTTYKLRKPAGFVVDYSSDIKNRRFIYDGKNFTVYSPKLGFYSSVPAPATNREVLQTIYDKFGIALPLEDLFRWADGSHADRIQALKSAYNVGPATIDGVATDHYAFREDNVDWEVWIQQGNQPFPKKLVIVDRNDPAKPTFIARLSWTLNPALSDADFAFAPDANAKKIQMATFKGSGE